MGPWGGSRRQGLIYQVDGKRSGSNGDDRPGRQMTVRRGDVRWGPALHKASPAYRPWLVVSIEDHPFAEEECIAIALTTTDHDEGIPVPDDVWRKGGSERSAYASPWYVSTLKIQTFDRTQGRLTGAFVDRVVAAFHRYVPVLT